MSETPNIVVLPGDGIGPEIVGAARQVLDSLGEFNYDETFYSQGKKPPITEGATHRCSL